VQFTYYSGGGTGADGISFFLLNADLITAAGGTASTVVAGGYGGGLGYSDDGRAGITDGWLGLGFDTFGNYSGVDRGQTGTGALANAIGVRGSGSGTSGYALLSAHRPMHPRLTVRAPSRSTSSRSTLRTRACRCS